MGNWNVTIQGVGCHHNNAPHDIESLTKKFVADVKAAGHSVSLANVTTGGLTDTMPPGDFKERVLAENAEVATRFAKLADFIDTSPVFTGLPEAEKVRMRSQATAMEAYKNILRDRIEAFGK